jgi:hypothetical protein
MTEHPNTESIHEANATAEQIRDVERLRLRALVEANMENAERLHAPDFQLITPRGNALSKEQYLAAVAGGEIQYRVWEPGPMEVRVHGGSAVIRYKAELQQGSRDGNRPSFLCWHTDSYEMRDGRWQVVWSQATKIDDLQTTNPTHGT